MVADVLMRDFFNAPIDGVAEMVAISIIAIVFLQLGSTLRHGRMSRADLFIDGFTLRRPRLGNLLHVLFSLAGAFVCAVIFYATWPTFIKAWVDSEFYGVQGVFTMPTWPVKLIVLVGCAVTAIQYLLHALAHGRRAVASPANASGSRAMTGVEVGLLAVVLMLVAIYFGMHIGVALILTSFLSVWLLKSPALAARMVAASANDSLRDYLFGVIPLFVLMGLLVSCRASGATPSTSSSGCCAR
jgi:TRAP-type mannitol/chloroaromatic compound transport system permease small subunit